MESDVGHSILVCRTQQCITGYKWQKYQSLVAGIKRATAHRKKIRKPLKTEHLRNIMRNIHRLGLNKRDCATFKSAILLAFFDFLRCSEYTCTPYNKKHWLRRKDVKIHPKFKKKGAITLRLCKTKVNQFSSSTVHVFGNGTDLCPVRSLIQYLSLVTRPAHQPLFWISGKPLSNSKFNSILKLAIQHIGLNPKTYSSHSLRSGAATTASFTRGASMADTKAGSMEFRLL